MALDLTRIARERGVDLRAWPTRYDRAYRPAPEEQFWLPEVERADPEERDELILAKLRAQVRWAWEKSPFYRRKWDEAGVSPDTLRKLGDLSRFPVVQKNELRAAQAAYPPFGDYLCIDPQEVVRIHGTSGTTGRPTVFGIGRDDWSRIAEAHARILWGAGIRPRDLAMISSGIIMVARMASRTRLAPRKRLRAKAYAANALTLIWRLSPTTSTTTELTSPRPRPMHAPQPGGNGIAPASSKVFQSPLDSDFACTSALAGAR